MTLYYTIDNEKLEEVTRMFNKQVDPQATEELVKTEICADWAEGDDHQEWINTASEQEIVDWLASFYD